MTIMTSLKDRYFAEAKETVGPRSPEIGVTPEDRLVLDVVTGRKLHTVDPAAPFRELEAIFKDFTLVNSGGISNQITMLQHHGLKQESYAEPLLVGHFQKALKEGNTPAYAFDYAGSLKKCIERTEEEAGKGVFKQIHGYDLENYLEMPYTEFQKVGRIKKSTEAGIYVPTWDFVQRRDDGKLERIFESAPVPYSPQDVLDCIAFCWMGRSIFNPQKLSWFTVGDRGYSTPLGNAILYGVPTIAYPAKEGIEFQGIEGIEDVIGQAYQHFDYESKKSPIKSFCFVIRGQAKGNRPVKAEGLLIAF